MAYEVDFSDLAKATLLTLPLDAAMAIAEIVAEMSADPWNYARSPDDPLDRSLAHRCITFAGGFMWCLVLDRDAEVYVTEIHWVG